MAKHPAHTIVIIGCGNVAWHIAKQLHASKKYALSIYNHAANPVLREFSSTLKCKTTVGLDAIEKDADLYLVCVSDKAIPEVSKKITIGKAGAIVLHTSGSLPVEALAGTHSNKGVFYPLQSFSKNDAVQWNEVPLILEAATAGTKKGLTMLAKLFTEHAYFLTYKQRLKLHLAAVLVNNFTNALYAAALELVPAKEKGLGLLLPIIRQTTAKLEHLGPLKAQTGPAKRKDKAVLKKHLALLADEPELRKIYKQVSKLIVKQQAHA
jgi:predicted short-subunit dehydrogenase-like oxidoreductase (DUF2520 family)